MIGRRVAQVRGVTDEGECTVSVVRRIGWWQLDVACTGELHRIELRRGRIRLVRHNVRAEMAESGLAGRPSCACLALAWSLENEGWAGDAYLGRDAVMREACWRNPARLVAEDLVEHFRLRGYRL